MDQTVRNRTLLWWIAFVAEMIAAVLETFEGDYLKAAGLFGLSAGFLIMALGKGSEEPLWRKVSVGILATLSIGIFIYRFIWHGKF